MVTPYDCVIVFFGLDLKLGSSKEAKTCRPHGQASSINQSHLTSTLSHGLLAFHFLSILLFLKKILYFLREIFKSKHVINK